MQQYLWQFNGGNWQQFTKENDDDAHESRSHSKINQKCCHHSMLQNELKYKN